MSLKVILGLYFSNFNLYSCDFEVDYERVDLVRVAIFEAEDDMICTPSKPMYVPFLLPGFQLV
jgi:hypothetical protein